MKKLEYKSEYFNIVDTLECGQIFRFVPHKNGYLVFSADKCCYAYTLENKTVIECNDGDEKYFINFFDLERDYSSIVNSAKKYNGIVEKCAELSKGIRILNQNREEMLFSFIVSQNNNIPRIKGIIERLCVNLGKEFSFNGIKYYAFPSAKDLSNKPLDFFYSVGLGYRAPFIKRLADGIVNGFDVEKLNDLSTLELKSSLTSIYGVGNKVADCVALFGFHRTDSFPVDTWIEKVYIEDFKGKLTDRNKISKWFTDAFKENSGYVQQYLFYYKRSKEKK